MKRSFPLSLLLACLALTASAAEKYDKWIYVSRNLLVDKSVDDLEALMKRGQAAGYNHILLADSKSSRLEDMDKRYFNNVDRVKALATKYGIEIVPALFSVGYSNDLLSRDPNLIEAIAVKNVPLIVKGGVAQLDDPTAPTLPGGDFSDPKKWSWYDQEVITFENGAAKVTAKGTNARIVQKLKVQPHRQYHVTVRVKTEDFKGTPEVKALTAKGAQLNWENLGIKRTQHWTEHHAVFNSQDNAELNLFFGSWGAQSGTMWWDDATIEEIAFMNMPRRPGCPVSITTADGKPLEEGKDFEPVRDPLMGSKPWAGEYDTYHQPPQLGTRIPDGTRLLANYYAAQTVYDHQAMICPSEPKTMELLRKQAQLMHKTWGAKGYMMSHDEIRMLNHCEACQKRNLTPGQIIADNVKSCIGILKEVNPDGQIYVWNDMFDPNHNAVKGPYYLVNGTLEGSWEGLTKDVVIVPWYYSKRNESLKFFADRGHKQVVGGYYDKNPEKIADWITAARNTPGSVIGLMYTTWENKYEDLEKFSAAIDSAR